MFLQVMRASIRRSIVLLGLVGAASTALVAAEGAWRKEQMRQQATLAFDAKDVVADILPPPMYLVEMRLLVSQFLEGSVDRPTAKQRFEALASSYEQRAQFWRSHPPHGLERLLLGPQHDTARQFMDAVRSRLIDAPDIDPAARARELTALHQLYEQHRLAVDRTVEEANRFAEQAIGTLEAEQAQSAIIAMTVLVVAFALVAIGSQRVYRGVQQPLQGCAALARRLATGDLRRSDDAGKLRHDVIGEMQRSLEDMRQRWVRIVGTVAGSAEGVATASQQIARANLDLSARTEKQASALQETSATMEQLGAMVRSSAEHAGRADQLAAEASDIAAHGGSSVGQVVQTMRGIDGRSQQIASIVKIIDDLAFQTNILALNAAVEAARAGEHGRGFAVVAAEVRALAQRSASSAHEIGELISASVDHTREGAALADTAGETMGRIVESIRRVSDTISQISGTGREQSLGVGQVVEAVHQIDHATQQNAALVEETAAAADSLRAQADQLVQAVGVFRFDRSEVESARVSEAAAVA